MSWSCCVSSVEFGRCLGHVYVLSRSCLGGDAVAFRWWPGHVCRHAAPRSCLCGVLVKLRRLKLQCSLCIRCVLVVCVGVCFSLHTGARRSSTYAALLRMRDALPRQAEPCHLKDVFG